MTEVVTNMLPIPTIGATKPPIKKPLAPNAAEATPALLLSLSKAIAVGTGCNKPKENISMMKFISVRTIECNKIRLTIDNKAPKTIITAPNFRLFLPCSLPAAEQPMAIATALTAKHRLKPKDDSL